MRYESFVGCESTTHAMANPTNLPSSLSAKVRVVLSLVVPPLGQVVTIAPLWRHGCAFAEPVVIDGLMYLRYVSPRPLSLFALGPSIYLITRITIYLVYLYIGRFAFYA